VGQEEESVLVLNYNAKFWIEYRETLPITFQFGACGLVRKANGEREIVVTLEEKSWIFSLDSTKVWRDGPPLPGVAG